MAYYELWNILSNWRKEFTVKEFNSTFVSPDANKVLHDMAQKGLLENTGWGKYQVNSQSKYLTKKMNVSEAYSLVKESAMKYAFTGPDAVFFWTKGGYQVDRFLGFYPIHLLARKSDLERWKKFLASRKRRFYVKDKPIKETLFGLFYVLYPRDEFRAETVEGFNVISLKETLQFCENNIYSYEPALEMLNEIYSLGLHVKYRETETNF